MSERGAPYAAWTYNGALYTQRTSAPQFATPVVVTPILDSDPRPGEMWRSMPGGGQVCITGAPYPDITGRMLVQTNHGLRCIDHLERIPPEPSAAELVEQIRVELIGYTNLGTRVKPLLDALAKKVSE